VTEARNDSLEGDEPNLSGEQDKLRTIGSGVLASAGAKGEFDRLTFPYESSLPPVNLLPKREADPQRPKGRVIICDDKTIVVGEKEIPLSAKQVVCLGILLANRERGVSISEIRTDFGVRVSWTGVKHSIIFITKQLEAALPRAVGQYKDGLSIKIRLNDNLEFIDLRGLSVQEISALFERIHQQESSQS